MYETFQIYLNWSITFEKRKENYKERERENTIKNDKNAVRIFQNIMKKNFRNISSDKMISVHYEALA